MEATKKFYIDLFASPSTLIPIVGGLTAGMFTWGLKLPPIGYAIGFIGLIVGSGTFLTKLLFGLDDLAEKSHEYAKQQKLTNLNSKLDHLESDLKTDRDKRTGECLRQLRSLYRTYVEDEDKDKKNEDLREQIEVIFHACVRHLERSYELWENSRSIGNDARKKLLKQRGQIVQEVVETIEHLNQVVSEFHNFAATNGDDDLKILRSELDITLRVAKRTEEWKRKFDGLVGKSHDNITREQE